MRDKLKVAPADDWEKLSKMATEEQAMTRNLEQMMNEWSELAEELANEHASAAGEQR